VAVFGPPNVAKLDAMGRIDGLVKAAKYKKDPQIQAAAREALTGYLDKVIQRLQTKNLVQLDTAREALLIIGEPARDRLIFILKEGHLHRRQDAAYVLGEMRDPVAVQPLTVALHNPDALLRMLCVQALAKIGGPEAGKTLEKATRDPEPRIQQEAQKALLKMRKAGVI
jgi:HEAT repeat protein